MMTRLAGWLARLWKRPETPTIDVRSRQQEIEALERRRERAVQRFNRAVDTEVNIIRRGRG